MKSSIILLCSIFLTAYSCKKEEVISKTNTSLIGKWKLTGVFLSDALDSPCSGNTPSRDITIEFTNKPSGVGNSLSLNGQSTVNLYFANYEANTDGAIKITTLGSTKIAGTPEMMQCESRLFTLLQTSEGYKVVQVDTNPAKIILQLGIFRTGTIDAGTYLVFEKI